MNITTLYNLLDIHKQEGTPRRGEHIIAQWRESDFPLANSSFKKFRPNRYHTYTAYLTRDEHGELLSLCSQKIKDMGKSP